MSYVEIKRLKDQGWSIRKIAKQLGISRNTVSKYLKKNTEEMTVWLASTKTRKQKLDVYHDLILGWIQEHPDISSSQIHDWLEERGVQSISESTVRRYVRLLREEHRIPKELKSRTYEAIPDPEMGFQAQVDFGQVWVFKPSGERIKLYLVAFVLSHSRYKYMEWLDRPFTTHDLIQAHENAFKYYGGKPTEIVYDQDNIIVVSENGGDIIFTSQFDLYRQIEPFEVYACRGFDPETKGRIENVIGFIKGNFAKNRLFYNLKRWNEDALQWLVRKGNGKQHNTTKQVPAKVFEEEKKHLTPDKSIRLKTNANTEITSRIVRKDNTIMYKSNRYSVPLGTHSTLGTEVEIYATDGILSIVSTETGELIAKHSISTQKGILIQDRNHTRNRDIGLPEMAERVIACFDKIDLAHQFIQKLDEKYPRYRRDQYQMLLNFSQAYEREEMIATLEYCMNMELYSANEFKDAHHYLYHMPTVVPDDPYDEEPSIPLSAETERKLSLIKTEKRSLEVYSKMMEGS